MRKSRAVAGALFLLSASALAEVKVYGVLDVSVGTVAHQFSLNSNYSQTVNAITPTKAPDSVAGIFNGGIQNSRWGIKGSDDLGEGRKAFFTLESGFAIQSGQLSNHAQALIDNAVSPNNASSGSTNGQLFSRLSFVGLSDQQIGSLQFGRNYTPIYDVLSGGYDPVQFAVLFSPLGFSSKYGGGSGVSENVRQDNSIKYLHHFGLLNFAALYKFGAHTGNNSAQTAYSFQLGYEDGPLGIQAAYQAYKDAFSAATAKTPIPANVPDLTVTQADTQGFLIATKYRPTDALTLKAGYQRYTLSPPSAPISGTTSYYGYNATVGSPVSADRSSNIWFAGGDYQFTPSLNLAAGYYLINEDGYPGATYTPSGNVNVASTLLDYRFSKLTDVYAGALTTANGGKYAGYPNNSIFALGLRHKF